MIESEENSLAESGAQDDASGEFDNALEYSLGPSGSTKSASDAGDRPQELSPVREPSPARKSGGSDASSDHLNRLYYQPPQMRTRAEIWLDLTSIDAFDPPSQIKETLVQLKQIENEWAIRAAASLMVDKPLMGQWATDVAGADALDPNSAPEPGPAPIDDSEVRPEDAVDYRLEATAPQLGDPAPPTPVAVKKPSGTRKALSYISGAIGGLKLKLRLKRAANIVAQPAKKVTKLFAARDKGKK